MSQLTDEQFEVIYNKYYVMLLNIANKYVRNSLDSEDIVQEVFIKFYRIAKTFKNDESIKYYLIRLTINRSLNMIKTRKKLLIDNEYINNLPDISNTDEKSGSKQEIYNCVCLLKDNYKTVIMLYYYENYSLKQIANILKISESNASTRLNRAREKIKKIIEERNKNDKRGT